MKRTVFFLWQSDLPNISNRGFIEDCIKKAINQMRQVTDYQLILNFDRDTISKHGTPDIANTIFDKIWNNCKHERYGHLLNDSKEVHL